MLSSTESAARSDTGVAVSDFAAPGAGDGRPAARSRWPPRPAWLYARRSVIALALLLVITNTALGVVAVRGLRSGYAQVQSVESALAALSRLRTDTDELAHDCRAFMLASQPDSFDRYRAARQHLTDEIVRVRALTADIPTQQHRLAAMQRWIGDEGQAMDAANARIRPLPAAALVQEIETAEQRGDAIRILLDDMQKQERTRLGADFKSAAQRIGQAFVISEFRTLFTIGLITLMLLLVRRDRRASSLLAAEHTAELADASQALQREATERREAQYALRTREVMLHGLTDSIPQMVFVLFRDGTGEFRNRRWHDYTGAADYFSRGDGLARVHPDDAAGVTARWRQAVSQGAPYEAEFRLRGKDDGYRWFLAQAVPIAEPDDDVAAWVGALTDIDDIRRADEAVRESEDRFRRIFEGSPFGITLAEGDDRRILQANPAFCRMLGYEPTELIGSSLMDVTHPDEKVQQRAFAQLENVGPGWRVREKRYLTKQGAVVWARIRVSVFDPHGGGGPQLLAVVEDITRQHELDESLRQAQRMEAVGQLSGGLAHDFNNLLGVIIGNIEYLLETMADDPERAELAREVLDSALGGAELTRRLLAFGRRQSLSPQHIDLSAQAARHVSLLSRTLGRAIRIETMFAGDLWSVQADPSRLGDALLNLALNARDAMPHGGVLTIETHNDRVLPGDIACDVDVDPGDYAALAVSDTGVGMPPEVRARAVEPFFTTKPPGAGSGLGLSMIHSFVRQSGGHLTISSAVGIGTTVTICLPRVSAEDAPIVREASEPGLPTGKETILVVDDSAKMRQVAERHLHFLGYSVVTAENGPAALALLRAGTPVDLLFTDIAMPEGLTGFQLAEAARGMRPGLKVLFTTGDAGVRDAAGAVDWQERLIHKPYRRPELAEKIRTALSA